QVAPVIVISGASAFGRNHGGAQRCLRRALGAERRALVGFLQSLEDLAADADLRFARADVLHVKDAVRIVISEGVAQLVAALGNDSDTAPASVGDVKDPGDHLPCRYIALAGDGARILVFDDGASLFQLANGEQ